MRTCVEPNRIATLAAWIAMTGSAASAFAQPVATPASAQPAAVSVDSINAEHERELTRLERRRIDALGRLALSQPKGQAAATYDACFRLAIARNLFDAAAPYAAGVIRSEDPASGVAWLAHVVQIVGEADRGAYEQSLKSLADAIKPGQARAAAHAAGLPPAATASIVDAYYQRLLYADQIEVARKAMTLVLESAESAQVRDLATRRLKQLDLVGKPAPAISGLDLDGKPFALADAKGQVTLVVFWATWCVPNAQQMPLLDSINNAYKSKGLRVVGINLDSAQDGAQELKSVLPNIRRFLLDHNVTWPTLLNGPGELDYAKAYGVTEIPASVLIGRDGKVTHLDLVGRKLEKAIAEDLARNP